MLNRLAAKVAIIATAMVSGLVLPAPVLAQDGGTVCAEFAGGGQCVLWLHVTLSGDPAKVSVAVQGGGGGGFQAECDRGPNYTPGGFEQQTVPCNRLGVGWYSQAYDCHFLIEEDMDPADLGVILPPGYQAGDAGQVYRGRCYTGNPPEHYQDYCWSCATGFEGDGHYRFLAEPPDGFGGTPDPVPDLLVEAIEVLGLEGPAITTAPPAYAAGLVRLPVWLWNEVSGSNWGIPSQRAGPIAGISVVAQAEAMGIDWDMGDGTIVSCDEGVAWEVGMPVFGPPCGHVYLRASRDQTGGRYPISATTTWAVQWWAEGLSEQRGGEFALQATSTESLQIDELQVLTSACCAL